MIKVILDSDFSTLGQTDSKWAILTHEGVQMKPVLQDSVLTLEIGNTRGANWHGELRYSPFTVRKGDIFTASFSARSKIPFPFSVWLGQQNSPWKSLVPEENHFGSPILPAAWQDFTHTWHPFMDEESARMNFVLGQIDNTVEIKNVRLSKA